jgi:alkaline phosphatase
MKMVTSRSARLRAGPGGKDGAPAACYAHSNCRRNPGIFARKSLDNLANFDQIIACTVERFRKDTLLLFTADHSYGLRLAGGRKGQDIVPLVKVQAAHTAEEVLVAAVGPGSQHIKGAMENPELFRVMLSAYGWKP